MNETLAQAISAAKLLEAVMPTALLCIKDLNSRYVFCSQHLAESLGTTVASLLGQPVSGQAYDDTDEVSDQIIEEDRAVISTKKPQSLLKIARFNKTFSPHWVVKSPIISAKTGEVVGVFVQGFEALLPSIHDYLNTGSDEARHDEAVSLTAREKQVVFLFLANFSSQAIAETLGHLEGKRIAKSTIDSVFNDQLYIKFNVASRKALRDTLLEKGFGTKMPATLLKGASIRLSPVAAY